MGFPYSSVIYSRTTHVRTNIVIKIHIWGKQLYLCVAGTYYYDGKIKNKNKKLKKSTAYNLPMSACIK